MADIEYRPVALVESATVTRLYYLEGKTKSEIANLLSINRFKVARILEAALAAGYVRIEMNYPVSDSDVDLSSRLKSHLGLQHCLVIPGEAGGNELLMRDLGAAVGTLILGTTSPSDVLGFAWSRAMEAMISSIRELDAESVVQLCGAYPGAGTQPTALDLVREIGRKANGRVFTYYAPLIATDPPAAEAIRRQVDCRAASEMYSKITTAVVGVGAWAVGTSTVVDSLDRATFDAVAAQGVVAELCGGVHLDNDGRAIPNEVSARSVSIGSEHLAAIPSVIGVAYGRERAIAVRAAVRGGYVKSLVTHTSLAATLLEMPA